MKVAIFVHDPDGDMGDATIIGIPALDTRYDD